jgi:hypothetical protein
MICGSGIWKGGAVRRPQHEGAAVVNRWLFTESWKGMVQDNLLGPAPAHEKFRP